MSIAVFVGHTGQCLNLDPSTTTSLDALRSWITSQTGIQPRSQILLTAQGKQVRSQTLLTESGLFVFDSSWLNGKKAASPSKESVNSADGADFSPGTAPDTIANQNDLQSWQNLFRLRKSWAAGLLNGCSARAQQAERYQEEQSVIERSVSVAVASLQLHIKNSEKQYARAADYSTEILQDQQTHADNWEHNLGSLRSIPARAEYARFIEPMAPASGSRRNSMQHITTLQGFVDVVTVKQAASNTRSQTSGLAGKVDQIRDDLDSATKDSNDLLQAVEQLAQRSIVESSTEHETLIDEIRVVVDKMSSDFEHVQALPKAPQHIAQASKMALLHTKSYVPNLLDYCNEINELTQRRKQQRDAAADTALEHMRKLAAIEQQIANLQQDVREVEAFETQDQSLATLSIVARLPSVYGQLLVESVRRREWVAKMKRDSATLKEEVATYQEEEDKRRKKWMRVVEDIVPAEALQSRVLSIELGLQNEGGSWPMTTRDELDEYLQTILSVHGQGPVTDEIEQAIKDLDKPTRKQIKHARAFKNGSMHEAAFGDTSLLLRGDEQYKGLRDSNVRLEEELKAQKSRVRKLEDLLHRQTQSSRASTGDVFTPSSEGPFARPFSTPPVGNFAPPPSDDMIRNPPSLIKQRRPSTAGPGAEEKRLAKRVVDLEAEVQSYKDEVTSRKNSDAEFQKQVEEATSTKRDLMENMDAQQREFAEERRNLEKDLADMREKLEEAENEVERLLGSRDGVDGEIARLKEDAAGHAARAATEHDARSALERRFQIAEAAKAQAEEELQKARLQQEEKRETEAGQLQSLATAHSHLSPNAETPDGLVGLATALEELARKSAAHAKDLAEAVAFAKSENQSLWSSNERQKSELTDAEQRQSETEQQVREVQENLSAEEAKAKSLEEQLNEEQEQLRMLRSKFAEGETGSEVLRQRVTDEEDKAKKLASELAEAKSHINSLDVELFRLQKKHKAHQSSAEASAERLGKRADRAKEVSQKLYLQNQRLGRLLERLGLVMSYQGDAMTIERASKMAASTVIMDPHSQMSRQVSVASPPPTRKSSTADSESANDLRLLHWPDAASLEEESAQYEAFLNHISRFDLDVFSDAVTKRVKDFEYTAKKYSKEAKDSTKRAEAYKERAVKLRNEGHAKIAVRDFKEGDLALFLPTRGGQVKGAWAAFNIGCPHYFLAEREGMRLGTRDFIVARIQKVEQKVVDLSGQRASHHNDNRSLGEASDAPSSMNVEDDNPFDLSDGLTWWMVHATEERGAGAAPTTPGLGKSTVAAANVDAKGSIRIKPRSKGDDASKHLNKSLDSRRSSSTSKKGVNLASTPTTAAVAVDTRQRPESKASSQDMRPLPAPAGSGLGIVSTNDSTMTNASASTDRTFMTAMQPPSTVPQQQQQHDQIRHVSTTPQRPTSSGRTADRGGGGGGGMSPRTRSKSPSKSVRSLQQHLDTAPKPSPAKQQQKKSGWESLFSAEFSLESPTKEKKNFG
ncbi:Autophagy-related protein 11 [Fulvia fulva]|nr:Autophagy-related protein 11 [Fulvia fulva]WPV17654.1 Autophagy-related protein 11 [Fulvia fulva]